MDFRKIFILFVFLLVGCETVPNQKQLYSDFWTQIGTDSSGVIYFYHSKSLLVSESPRVITANFLLRKSEKISVNSTWKINCEQHNVTQDGVTNSVASDGNTIRKKILIGFCGLRDNGKNLYLIGSIFNTSSKAEEFVFVDASSIGRSDYPYTNGAVYNLIVGNFNVENNLKFIPASEGEAVASCEDPYKFSTRSADMTSYVSHVAEVNSVSSSANFLICSGYFGFALDVVKKNANSVNQLNLIKDSSEMMDINLAKTKCKELGFEEKTEKFGNCVLKLSK